MLRLAGAVGGLAVSFALVGAANAAVIISSDPGAPDPGPNAGETEVITFDAGLEPGVTLTGGQIVSGSSAGKYAAPAGDTTAYLAVGANGAETAVLTFADFLGGRNVSQFSFYWGSIDRFNSLELLSRTGAVLYSLNGAGLPPATGDQLSAQTNRRVTFTLTGADAELGGLRVSSTRPSFELDTISFAVAAVPEPGTWALMVFGFGAMGAALRRPNLRLGRFALRRES